MNYDTRIKKSQRPLRIDPIVDELCAKHERVRRAAPELLRALKDLVKEIHAYRLLDVKKRFSLCTADAQAGTAITKAEGHTS